MSNIVVPMHHQDEDDMPGKCMVEMQGSGARACNYLCIQCVGHTARWHQGCFYCSLGVWPTYVHAFGVHAQSAFGVLCILSLNALHVSDYWCAPHAPNESHKLRFIPVLDSRIAKFECYLSDMLLVQGFWLQS